MSRSKLEVALDDFVQLIVGIAEETAQDTLVSRANEIRTVRHAGRKPMRTKKSAKKATKSGKMTKPCPVPECENMGAPRLGMMCSDHKNLSPTKKNTLRFKAKEPGGKWNTGSKMPKKAAKRTKKKAAAGAKKAAAKAATA